MTPPDRRSVVDYLGSLTDAEYAELAAEARDTSTGGVNRGRDAYNKRYNTNGAWEHSNGKRASR